MTIKNVLGRDRTAPSHPRVRVRSARDRRALEKQLREGLERMGGANAGEAAVDLQPLIRVSGSASYPQFRQEQQEAWRRQGGRYSAEMWPALIEEGDFAVVLIPISAGRVGLAAGRHPRAIAMPQFSSGHPLEPGNFDDIVLAILATWIEGLPAEPRVRIAPPVVEVMQRGRVVARRQHEFGQRWHLPAADGM